MSSAVGPEVSTASHWGPQGQPRLRDHFPHGDTAQAGKGDPPEGLELTRRYWVIPQDMCYLTLAKGSEAIWAEPARP